MTTMMTVGVGFGIVAFLAILLIVLFCTGASAPNRTQRPAPVQQPLQVVATAPAPQQIPQPLPQQIPQPPVLFMPRNLPTSVGAIQDNDIQSRNSDNRSHSGYPIPKTVPRKIIPHSASQDIYNRGYVPEEFDLKKSDEYQPKGSHAIPEEGERVRKSSHRMERSHQIAQATKASERITREESVPKERGFLPGSRFPHPHTSKYSGEKAYREDEKGLSYVKVVHLHPEDGDDGDQVVLQIPQQIVFLGRINDGVIVINNEEDIYLLDTDGSRNRILSSVDIRQIVQNHKGIYGIDQKGQLYFRIPHFNRQQSSLSWNWQSLDGFTGITCISAPRNDTLLCLQKGNTVHLVDCIDVDKLKPISSPQHIPTLVKRIYGMTREEYADLLLDNILVEKDGTTTEFVGHATYTYQGLFILEEEQAQDMIGCVGYDDAIYMAWSTG